jgi:hypothetical protein
MPEVRLDAVDAAELAELLQVLAAGWPATLTSSARRWLNSSAIPLTAPTSCARTCTGSRSCSAAMTASPCSVPARPGWGDDHGQPAARAQQLRRRRLRRRSSSGAPRMLRGRPSGPKGASHRAARDIPSGAALDPGDRCGPLGAGKAGRPRPAPALRAARKPGAGGPQGPAGRQDTGELAFDSHKKRENYKPRVVSRIK